MPGATKWGSEFVINTTTTPVELVPVLTPLLNGRFFAAWQKGFSGDVSVLGQLLDTDGVKSGAEFEVDTPTGNDHMGPSVATLPDGRFVATWWGFSSTGPDTNGSAVFAQFFDANGSKSGDAFVVNTTTAAFQEAPKIAVLPDGHFVVAWIDFSSTGGDTSSSAVRAQIFNGDGTKSGSEFLVNTTTPGPQQPVTLTVLPNGNFIVAWQDNGTNPNATPLFRAQQFTADSNKAGAEFQIGVFAAQFVTLAALQDGHLVSVWQDLQHTLGDTSGNSLHGQILDANGTAAGPEFLVNTTTAGNQFQPTIKTLSDGRFVVAWVDNSIRAQVFNINGSKSGTELLVNTTSTGDFGQPTITELTDGRFVLAWSADGNNAGTVGNIRAQIFDPRESPVNLTGTPQDDVLAGTNIDDTLNGVGGNDRLVAADGDDTLIGGDGNDILDGGPGTDTMNGGTGNDVYIVDNLNDLVTENANEGSDRTIVFVSGYTLPANVELGAVGTFAGMTLNANPIGASTLVGNNGDDTLNGGAGHDTIDGAAGADTMIGATGDDTYVVNNPGDIVTENVGEGTDTVLVDLSTYILPANVEIGIAVRNTGHTITGSDGGVILFGAAGNDTLIGGAGADQFAGGLGNEYIDGKGGADAMGGGPGDDTYVVDNPGDGVFENLNEGTDTVISLLTNYQLSTDVEDGVVGLVTGGTLTGNNQANFLSGNSGDDVLNGGSGSDVLAGGFGNDLYYVQDPGDQVIEQPGQGSADMVVSLLAAYTMTNNVEVGAIGLTGDAYLAGNSQANTLFGNTGKDTLDGKVGADIMAGGPGDDLYYVDDSGDVVSEQPGQGTDMVMSYLATYTMTDSIETGAVGGTSGAALIGNNLGVTLFGNVGGDMLYGGSSDDYFNASAGNDWLIGAGGVNIETGGSGADHFVFTFGDGGKHTITDFSGSEGDVIDMRNMAAAGVTTFAQLQGHMSQNGSEVLIDFGGTDQIHVQNTLLTTLENHSEYFLIM